MFDILRDGDEELTKVVLSKRLERLKARFTPLLKVNRLEIVESFQIEVSMENRLVLKDHFRDSIESSIIVSNAKNTCNAWYKYEKFRSVDLLIGGLHVKDNEILSVLLFLQDDDDDDDNNNNINDNSNNNNNHKSSKSSYSSILKIKANQEIKDIYHNYTDMVTEQQEKLKINTRNPKHTDGLLKLKEEHFEIVEVQFATNSYSRQHTSGYSLSGTRIRSMKPNKAKPDTIQHLNSIAIREYGSTLRKEGEEEEEKGPWTITVIDRTIYSIPKVNKVFEEDDVVVFINFMDAEGNYEIDRLHGRFTWCIPDRLQKLASDAAKDKQNINQLGTYSILESPIGTDKTFIGGPKTYFYTTRSKFNSSCVMFERVRQCVTMVCQGQSKNTQSEKLMTKQQSFSSNQSKSKIIIHNIK
ncbi:hypothetical protein PPL_09887 [Heterostelium album PN500]|uniref:ATP-dependent DNA ligase family profile domain-containing protein n=1 Tax=Heterostelium pallidum (strain ATCC 26659 / Pp 5 / PN500) TaxID=670386 RepID=D3BPC2_HETP5|nr:hypothetical protein PPL_09887 [Heterostelium album PN500]EFA77132.1 hypothetical protein PPL_09887 [Heterostelium album PN500]|eukprot:XP_020429261.1 hypothetical protein PPL_09887 [Heterostelium album PN500]